MKDLHDVCGLFGARVLNELLDFLLELLHRVILEAIASYLAHREFLSVLLDDLGDTIPD
jgi:hypothetical protein